MDHANLIAIDIHTHAEVWMSMAIRLAWSMET